MEPIYEQKILTMLNLFPGITVSMLHHVINAPAVAWRPVLESLLRQQKVIRVAVRCSSTSGVNAAADSEQVVANSRIYAKLFKVEDVRIYERLAREQHCLEIIY